MGARNLLLLLLAALCGLALGLAPAQGQAPTVDVVLTEESGVYVEVRDALREELGGAAEINVVSAAALEGGYKSDAQIVVTVGLKAFQAAARLTGKAAVLGTLIPRTAYEAVRSGAPDAGARGISAIYIDQPPARQLNLARIVAPGRQKIGFLVSAESAGMLPGFRTAARDQKLSMFEEQVNGPDDLYPALRRLLMESDAIVALPDSAVFNATTIVNILITTYRAQDPLFGFSPAYVKAGALAAVYSTPRHVGVQAAAVVKRYLAAGMLPQPQYPRQFAVSINDTVARSLGISVDDEATVLEKLIKAERE